MSPEAVDLLIKFQPALSALAGFTGVIITLVVNAWLARRQVRDNRKHERQSFALALASELRFHEAEFSSALRYGTNDGMVRPPILTPILDAYITRIGLLPPDRVEYVTGAYFVIKELTWKFNLLSEEIPGKDYRVLEGAKAAKLAAFIETALPTIQRAIRALDPNPAPFRPV